MSASGERVCEFLGVGAVFASEPMLNLLSLVERVAPAEATVLITGESGSGKEIIARAIHHYSLRCSKSWVDINCAALPENLLESELFGYEKGAFSGAGSTKPGLFELANHGTLFLDEIGDLDPRMQVKLLRILDGASYYRLGGVKKVSVDVRLIAATNQDLTAAVQQHRFRADLYHRLCQIRLSVPPLRERKDDIIPLALHYLASQYPQVRFSAAALEKIREYGWPGNVRELRNTVLRAAIMASGGEITPADLPEEVCADSSAAAPADPAKLDELERSAILRVLGETDGHQERAAAKLGISRRTLQRRIKAYRLPQSRLQSIAG
jgi:DNA-binding NtrC family response regulator